MVEGDVVAVAVADMLRSDKKGPVMDGGIERELLRHVRVYLEYRAYCFTAFRYRVGRLASTP